MEFWVYGIKLHISAHSQIQSAGPSKNMFGMVHGSGSLPTQIFTWETPFSQLLHVALSD